MDENNDGTISKEEFIAAGNSAEDFDKLNFNGDGSLEENELLRNRKKTGYNECI